MHSMIAREMAHDFTCSKSGHARYRPGMTDDQLKAVLDFYQCDPSPSGAGLPKKSKLAVKIRCFGGSSFNEEIAKAKRDDLIRLLCRALDHEPRQYLSEHHPHAPRRYHRFGLTFDYAGAYPQPKFCEGLGCEELRAFLELHPDAKMTAAQIKATLL